MSWLSRLIGKKDPPADGVTQPVAEDEEFIRELIASAKVPGGHLDVAALPMFQVAMAMDRARQAELVDCLTSRLASVDERMREFRSKLADRSNPHVNHGWAEIWGTRSTLYAAMTRLLAKKPPLSDDTLVSLLDLCLDAESYMLGSHYPLAPMVTAIEVRTKTGELPEAIAGKLAALGERLAGCQQDTQIRKFVERIQTILGIAPDIPVEAGEVWTDTAIDDLTHLGDAERTAWIELLHHCKSATGGTPTAKWLKQTQALVGQMDKDQINGFLSRWFILTDRKRSHSALTLRQWVERCAEEAFGKRRYELLQLLPDETRSWKNLETIELAIRQADDPWLYLRGFPDQPEVRRLYGDATPAFDLPASPPEFAPVEDLLIIPAHMELLAGLAWAGSLVADTPLTRSLGMLAVSMYRTVPGKGPRAVRVGNACITALGMIGNTDALGQLALLKVKVKFGGAQAAIDKSMRKLAEKLGVSTEDLEEMSVPAYGMTDVGCLTRRFGEFTAHLTAIDSRGTGLVWTRDDGKEWKSVPAAVKQRFAEDLKELMAAKKDSERMLPAQAARLDGLYLRRKSWPFSIWRERYLDHPLTGVPARRLLWNFTRDGATVAGVWLRDRLVDRLGNPIATDDENTVVTLWHPLHQEPRIVLGWRGFLEEWRIVQPFKQAHREVYQITPAEERTLVYSNRFAAHLLRQHQFNALCAARSWKNTLRLMVDDTYPPATRWLPEWGLRAEYWIDGAGSEYGEDTLESGAFRYVTTDQIRFYPIDTAQVTAQAGTGDYTMGWRNTGPNEPVPLAQVDPLVFSEVMRDADLFVGVGSVGNDPNWLDGGRNEQRRDYWHSVSFGDLNASAQTRKAILEKLVPKLKIAAACSFEDKFLIVQGKCHSYKIHLGSGNILIMPGDKYLCIVPAQGQLDKALERIFLPFEGDRTLSLILSKAFLLAADDRITDATILRQMA